MLGARHRAWHILPHRGAAHGAQCFCPLPAVHRHPQGLSFAGAAQQTGRLSDRHLSSVRREAQGMALLWLRERFARAGIECPQSRYVHVACAAACFNGPWLRAFGCPSAWLLIPCLKPTNNFASAPVWGGACMPFFYGMVARASVDIPCLPIASTCPRRSWTRYGTGSGKSICFARNMRCWADIKKLSA